MGRNLPAAGYRNNDNLNNAGINGNYWSSSLYEGYSDAALCVRFFSGDAGSYYDVRYDGLSVRPVTE